MNNTDERNDKLNILNILSEQLGLEPEDIDENDSLEIDLHMRPSDLSDFVEKLQEKGVDVSKIELTEIETVGDLIDIIGDNDLSS